MNKQHGLLPMVMARRLTVDCVEGGVRKRYARRDLSLLSVSLFLCLSFLPCLPTWEHRSEGRDADSDMWKLSSVVDAPLFRFLSLLPLISPPSPYLRLLAVFDRFLFQCAHAPLTAIKTVQVCMFAASLFLLR